MQPVAQISHPESLPAPPQSGAVRDQLHRRYFAEAGSAAARFGVTFPRVIRHLEDREAVFGPQDPSEVRYLDDLVHAIACIDDDGRAWADLQERYGQFLIRRCAHRGGQIEAALAVGRLFIELRRHALEPADKQPNSLWTYSAAMPLRTWLADRLGCIQAALPHVTVMTASDDDDDVSRRGTKSTIRVRTTRINLAQPIVPVIHSHHGNRFRLPTFGNPNGTIRISGAADAVCLPERGTG